MEPKIGAKVTITYEMLNSLLCIPEGCKIVAVADNPERDIVSFKFHSQVARRGASYLIGEGQEYPNIELTMQDIAKRAFKVVKDVQKAAAEPGRGNAWARDLIVELEFEENSNE